MNRVLILDFGSQFTQLIARRLRERKVYCEIFPANAPFAEIQDFEPTALVLSGGPHSVFDPEAPQADKEILSMGKPILGICYGMQWMAQVLGGKVHPADNREYGLMEIHLEKPDSALLSGWANDRMNTWMSHGDEVVALPEGFVRVAKSADGSLAIMEDTDRRFFALQFHPEVTHTDQGKQYFERFLELAEVKADWNLGDFAEEKIKEIQEQVGDSDFAICALSGGVDSSVAATLVEKALPGRLDCLYIDSGLQREGESDEVMKNFEDTGLRVELVDAREEFLRELAGKVDPEDKRKTIGRLFIEIFEREAKRIGERHGTAEPIRWMVQGTLYPDVIESMPPPGRGGFSSTIKSHHNVGGLPERMNLKLIEPLRELFKDEVRGLGRQLGVPEKILGRHPFPGPGLAIRCLGEVTKERLDVLRAADKLYIDMLKESGHYDKIWQAGVILLPVSTVGVMGDGRTYENPVALRAVTSDDGMTANWYPFPSDLLGRISTRIINEVKGVNRVVYDVSTKPPATIEWE